MFPVPLDERPRDQILIVNPLEGAWCVFWYEDRLKCSVCALTEDASEIVEAFLRLFGADNPMNNLASVAIVSHRFYCCSFLQMHSAKSRCLLDCFSQFALCLAYIRL